MARRPRRNRSAAFKAKVALAAIRGDRTLGVCEDPDDDKYIAAALEGRAAVIVIGDRGLLAFKEHQGIRIVTPRRFPELLGP